MIISNHTVYYTLQKGQHHTAAALVLLEACVVLYSRVQYAHANRLYVMCMRFKRNQAVTFT